MITFQPSLRSCRAAFRSRRLFISIFRCQKAGFELGMVARLHRRCPCQKQPLMKTTALHFGSTTSGDPGRSVPWSRNRSPFLCRYDLTSISGPVFSLRTRLISQLRLALEKTSLMRGRSLEGLLRSRRNLDNAVTSAPNPADCLVNASEEAVAVVDRHSGCTPATSSSESGFGSGRPGVVALRSGQRLLLRQLVTMWYPQQP